MKANFVVFPPKEVEKAKARAQICFFLSLHLLLLSLVFAFHILLVDGIVVTNSS